jgi:hypothetical protein
MGKTQMYSPLLTVRAVAPARAGGRSSSGAPGAHAAAAAEAEASAQNVGYINITRFSSGG